MNDPITGDDATDPVSEGTHGGGRRSPSRSAARGGTAARSVIAAKPDEDDDTVVAPADSAGAGATDDNGGRTTPRAVADAVKGDTDEGAATDADALDEELGSPWSVLRPLDDDDLAALDPAALEGGVDLAGDTAVGDIVEPAAPTQPARAHGPASSRTAEDLTAETVLRAAPRPPRSGWRRMIHQVTGGTVSPRASRSDREREEQLSAIRTLVTHPRRITVLSRKGGVGKTTTTLMLGQTLASERGDRIIAVDGNPDAGNLGYRVNPTDSEASVTDVLNEIENINRYADMRRFTTQTADGLEVLRSDDDPQISTALGDQEYGAILSLLDRFYNLVLIDTGTGILDSAVQGILDGTDQIVLVVAPSLDAARTASQTLDWLTEHGFVGLVEKAVAVINQTRRSSMVDVARIEDHFWDRCGATVRIPWDGFLEAGTETELEDLRPATREAYRHLAAAVARRFDV